MIAFVRASVQGTLESGSQANRPPIPLSFWTQQWPQANADLGKRPAIGLPSGARPDTPNDRIMEAFGTNTWREPLMAVDRQINAAKGRIMGLEQPVDIGVIRDRANDAVNRDSQRAVNVLLSSIRVVSLSIETKPLKRSHGS